MSEPLKPQFFITRQNGSIIPLIAMDELPHHFRIQDVPRTMTIRDTVGMTNLGEFPSRHGHYGIVDTNHKIHKHLSIQPNELQRVKSGDDSSSSSSTTTRVHIDLMPAPKKSFGIDEQLPSDPPVPDQIAAVKVPSSKATEAFGKVETLPPWKETDKLGARSLVPGKKIYCTHWMSTGECDYAQQGCLYKHEMPFDLEVLNFLGYQDIPRWYREKHGIGKLTAAPGSGAAVGGSSMQSTALQGAPLWRGYAAVNGLAPTHVKPLTAPSRGTARLSRIGSSKSRTRQVRQQTPGTLLTTPSTRPSPLPKRLPQPISKSVPTTNTLFDSKYAAYDPRPAPPPPSPVALASQLYSTTTLREDVNAREQYYAAMSRRSSLYSDAEADLIREADARREQQDREYEECKRNQALARLNASSESSEGDGCGSGSGSGASI